MREWGKQTGELKRKVKKTLRTSSSRRNRSGQGGTPGRARKKDSTVEATKGSCKKKKRQVQKRTFPGPSTERPRGDNFSQKRGKKMLHEKDAE